MINVARLRRAARREAIGVDVAAALNLVGALTKYLSLAFLFPAAVAIGYSEPVWPFLVPAVGGVAGGWALERVTHGKERVGMREGFLVVALTWLLAAVVGAVPYVISGEQQLAAPIDAFFESMSGFTTTGASVLTNIGDVPRSLLMWRQFSQWVGGMGIIVLALAVLPRLRVGGRQLFESEAPGPELELASRIRDTARRLWLLYVALTVVLIAALAIPRLFDVRGSMSFYDAVAHALTTMPTGGFSTRDPGVAAFGALSQWTILLFMFLSGINFALLYVILVHRRARALLRDDEFRGYVVLLVAAAAALIAILVRENLHEGEAAVRHGLFQAVAVMTGTGYASANYVTWGAFAAVVLAGLMFFGGSAGSTTGSVKVVRHLLIGRMLRRELDQTVHPEIVYPVRLNGRVVDERTLRAVIVFVLLYVGLFAVGAFAITFESALAGSDVTPFEGITAAAATLGNVGPSFGTAGPFGAYAEYSDFSKLVMIALMWLGRLEIIPVIVLLTKGYWRA